MSYYPIALELNNRKCLVVGGGDIARRKVASLVEAGARVTVIAPDIDARIREIQGVVIEQRAYRAGDIAGNMLVYTATDDAALNAAIYREADDAGIIVNSVDDPEHCSFIVPSVLRRGDLIVAVSTSGKSPALSKKLRRELEKVVGPEYTEYVALLGEMRDLVKAKYDTQPEREAVFIKLLDGGILDLLREGKSAEARQKALESI